MITSVRRRRQPHAIGNLSTARAPHQEEGKDGDPHCEGDAENKLGLMSKGALLLLWDQTVVCSKEANLNRCFSY